MSDVVLILPKLGRISGLFPKRFFLLLSSRSFTRGGKFFSRAIYQFQFTTMETVRVQSHPSR